MLSRTLAITTLSALVLLSLVLQLTSPSTIHPLGILLVLVLFYVSVLGALTFLIFGVTAAIQRKGIRTAASAVSVKRAYYYSSVLALAPVLLIGMRSIGRGTVWDVALVALFEIVALFYISKR